MGHGQTASQLVLAILLGATAAGAATAITATSPGDVVQATVSVDRGGVVRYDVRLRGRPLIEASALGLVLDSGRLDRDLVVAGHRSSRRSADWKPLYGERAVIPDRYKAVTVELSPRWRLFAAFGSSAARTTRAWRSATSCRQGPEAGRCPRRAARVPPRRRQSG